MPQDTKYIHTRPNRFEAVAWSKSMLLSPPPLSPQRHDGRDGDTMAEAVGGIRVVSPPDYTLTLWHTPDNFPHVGPSTKTVAGAATGGGLIWGTCTRSTSSREAASAMGRTCRTDTRPRGYSARITQTPSNPHGPGTFISTRGHADTAGKYKHKV